MTDKRVLVFGDSIAYGSWDTQGGWVERLKQKAHQQTIESNGEEKIQVINLSIGGDSSIKILNRLDREIQARLSDSWELTIVFAFGTNDARSENGIIETEMTEFTNNIAQIIDIAKGYSPNIIFIGSTPFAFNEAEHNGKIYNADLLNKYATELKKIVESQRIEFVDVHSAFEKENPSGGHSELFSFDNLHPNDTGHSVILKQLYPRIWEML